MFSKEYLEAWFQHNRAVNLVNNLARQKEETANRSRQRELSYLRPIIEEQSKNRQINQPLTEQQLRLAELLSGKSVTRGIFGT